MEGKTMTLAGKIIILLVIIGIFYASQRVFWVSMLKAWDITDSNQSWWYRVATRNRRVITTFAFFVVMSVSTMLLFI